MQMNWTLEAFVGYMRTWSAYKRFMHVKGFDPMIDLLDRLHGLWSAAETKTVGFELPIRVGRLA